MEHVIINNGDSLSKSQCTKVIKTKGIKKESTWVEGKKDMLGNYAGKHIIFKGEGTFGGQYYQGAKNRKRGGKTEKGSKE